MSIHEVKTRLSQLIQRALRGGRAAIARSEETVQLLPLTQDNRPREGGQWRGKVWIADDFDAPNPEIEKLFYSGER